MRFAPHFSALGYDLLNHGPCAAREAGSPLPGTDVVEGEDDQGGRRAKPISQYRETWLRGVLGTRFIDVGFHDAGHCLV